MHKFALTFVFAFVAFVAKAVSISWTVPEELDGATSAALVWSSSDSLSFGDDGSLASPAQSMSSVSGSALSGMAAFAGAVTLNDLSSPQSSSGYFFVVLFKDNGAQYKASDAIAYSTAVYTSPTNPMGQASDAVSGSNVLGDGVALNMNTSWLATPEPTAMALLLVGAAVAAGKRRKNLV